MYRARRLEKHDQPLISLRLYPSLLFELKRFHPVYPGRLASSRGSDISHLYSITLIILRHPNYWAFFISSIAQSFTSSWHRRLSWLTSSTLPSSTTPDWIICHTSGIVLAINALTPFEASTWSRIPSAALCAERQSSSSTPSHHHVIASSNAQSRNAPLQESQSNTRSTPRSLTHSSHELWTPFLSSQSPSWPSHSSPWIYSYLLSMPVSSESWYPSLRTPSRGPLSMGGSRVITVLLSASWFDMWFSAEYWEMWTVVGWMMCI